MYGNADLSKDMVDKANSENRVYCDNVAIFYVHFAKPKGYVQMTSKDIFEQYKTMPNNSKQYQTILNNTKQYQAIP